MYSHNFLPQLYTINFLSHRHGQCPHICLPAGVSGLPAKQHNPLEVHSCVILHTDEAEGIDHTVAHGYALNNVKRHQRVLLPGDERRVKIAQDGVAIIRSPAEDVCREDPNEHHDRLPPATQTLPDLIRLETGNAFEPKLPGDAHVAQGHAQDWAQELHGKNEEVVGTVVKLLVDCPDLSTEGFTVVGTIWHFGRRCKVSRRYGYDDRNNPHTCYQTVGSLMLHPGP